jgi:hypothetical protein
MEHNKTKCTHSLFAIFFLGYVAAAQIPVSKEPHHKVIFENEYVRLYDGQINVNDTTEAHIHNANTVVVFLSRSTFGLQNAGEKSVVTDVSPGDLIYRAFGETSVNHIVWNQSKDMFHFILVELVKQHPGNDTCLLMPGPAVKFEWQQDLVKAYSLNISKEKKFNISKTNCAYLLIDVSGRISTTSSGGQRSLQAGGFVFFPVQTNIEISNIGNDDASCDLLELK